MDAGARVMHVDVMDGHFVPPITIGPLIVESIRDLVHEPRRDPRLPPDDRAAGAAGRGVREGGRRRDHDPPRGDAAHPLRAADDPRARLRGGRRDQPGHADRGRRAGGRHDRPLPRDERQPGLGRAALHPVVDRAARAAARRCCRPRSCSRSTAASRSRRSTRSRDAGTDLFVAGSSVFGADDPAAAFIALANRVRLEPI